MDVESEKSVRSGQSSKSLISNRSGEMSQKSFQTKSTTTITNSSSPNTTISTTTSGWMSYSLTSTYYPLLPSQMPPLPALPAINSASSPTTGHCGGNSSSSTYANTTASEENNHNNITSIQQQHYYHQVPQQPVDPSQSQQHQYLYRPTHDPTFNPSLYSGKFPHSYPTTSSYFDYNNNTPNSTSTTNTPMMMMNYNPPFMYQKQSQPQNNNESNSLTDPTQASTIMNSYHHQPNLIMNQESWLPHQTDSIGALIYPPSVQSTYHHSYMMTTGPASEATGTTTLMGDESFGWTAPNTPNGNSLPASNANQLSQYYPMHQYKSHISNNTSNNNNGSNKKSRTPNNVQGFTPLLTSASNLPPTLSNQRHGNVISRFLQIDNTQINGYNCARSFGSLIAVCLSLAAFFSPAAMVTLPVTKVIDWPKGGIYCDVDCESRLIALTVKLILAGAAAYLTFLRRHFCCSQDRNQSISSNTIYNQQVVENDPLSGNNQANQSNHTHFHNPLTQSTPTLPRLTFLRSFLLFLTFIITIVFWLFYGIRVLDMHPSLSSKSSSPPPSSSSSSGRDSNSDTKYHSYHNAVKLASRMTDCLILVHYLGLVIIVLREITQETVAVKVLRCPDGETKIYTLRKMSVQLAAIRILRSYVIDFKVYNPFVEAPARRRVNSKGSGSRAGSGISLPPRLSGNVLSTVQPNGNTITGTYQPPPGALGGLAKYKFYDVDGPAPTMNSILTPTMSSRRSVGSPNSVNRCPSHTRRKTASLRSFGNRSQRSCPIIKNSPSSNTRHQRSNMINNIANNHPLNNRKPTSHTNSNYGNNDRYYEEVEYEKRISKRRVRLLLASEEAFRNLYKYDDNYRSSNVKPLDAYEAAQAIFSTLLRPLQKFLRTTRQQPRFSMEWVIGHLRNCLLYELGHRAFLEPFLSQGPVIEDPGYQQQMTIDERVVTSWTLISDRLVSQNICDGTVFQLQQGDISLFCTVRSLPRFSLTEQQSIFPVNERCDKFIFKLDSETSV